MSRFDILADYSNPNLRQIRPVFVTLDELRALIYTRFPAWTAIKWIDAEIHDLWSLGAPDLQREGARLLLPSQMQKWCHEVGQKMGAEIMGKE